MDGVDPAAYGDAFADVYDDWYADVSDVAATVDRLVQLIELAGGGPALELGVGTGRVAIPLAARGIEVHGVDASPAMLDALRAKPGSDRVVTHLGDMAAPPVPHDLRFALVFATYNTFFNLTSEEQQRACLESTARALQPDGRLVLECFVPADAATTAGGRRHVERVRVSSSEVVLLASRSDPTTRVVEGRHIHVTRSGVRVRPWSIRWAAPDELDELAHDAGLVLDDRVAGWHGEPFDATSAVHVSTYRARRR